MNDCERTDAASPGGGRPRRSVTPFHRPRWTRSSRWSRSDSRIARRLNEHGRASSDDRVESEAATGSNDEPPASERSESNDEPPASERSESDVTRSGTASVWGSSDTVLAEGPDRQVLVVGDGLVGRTLTCLLERSGYDPVLAAGTEQAVEPSVVQLQARGLEILAQLGMAERVRDRGTPIESVAVRCPTDVETRTRVLASDSGTDDPVPLAIESAKLRRVLDAERAVGRAHMDRTVANATVADDGIAVEFQDGVQEWFDAVVDTAGTRSLQGPGYDALETGVLQQYELRFESQTTPSEAAHDVWYPDGLVQRIPVSNRSESLLRITTPRGEKFSLGEREAVDELFEATPEAISTAVRDAEPTPVQQGRLEDGVRSRAAWGGDHVARCGAGACPFAPATGCGVSFGLDDAATFATELVRGDAAIGDVLAAYASDRTRKFSTVQTAHRTAHLDRLPSAPVPPGSALRTLERFRTVALEPMLESRTTRN